MDQHGFLREAIQDNIIFNSANDIINDKKTYDELVKIWKTIGKVDWDDSVDGEWVVNFYKQQKILLKKIGKPLFTEFCRDGGAPGGNYILPDLHLEQLLWNGLVIWSKMNFK